MRQDLAQELKNAGFPQDTEPCEVCNDTDPSCPIAHHNKQTVKLPSVGELFRALKGVTFQVIVGETGMCSLIDHKANLVHQSPDLEEVLSRFYLSIHDKRLR